MFSKRDWQTKNKEKVKAYNLRKREEHQKYWATHNPYEETQFKKCGKCQSRLLSVSFYRDNSTRDGLNGHCKDCAYRKNANGTINRNALEGKSAGESKRFGVLFEARRHSNTRCVSCTRYSYLLWKRKELQNKS